MKLRMMLAAVVLSGIAAVAQAQACPGVVHEVIKVEGRNDEWTSAEVKVNPGDIVITIAEGKVKLGNYLGWAGPDGNGNADGRLDMKVGTGTTTPVKSRWMGTFEQGGTIKFKVRDSNYSDNGGEYKVTLIIFPASSLPPPKIIDGEK